MRKMQTRKRSLAVILLTALMLLTLTACGQKNADQAPDKVISGVDDLEGAKIGVQIGTVGDTYASDYEGDDAGTEVARYNKGADAVQALKQNKIDCVIIDEQPALAFVDKNPELKILDEEFTNEDYAICVAKGNDELLDKINGALDELKQDGTLESIINNYIGVDAGKTPYVSSDDVIRDNGTLTMATNAAFPPYEYYENGTIVGIDADMAQAIADKLGMNLVISDMEFDSIIAAVQSGKADFGAAGLTVTEDRLKNINFSESYTTAKQVIIVNTGEGANQQSLVEKFKQVFIEKDRWQYIPKGLRNTLIITFFAGVIGIILGFLFAIIRVANDRNDEKKLGIRVLNAIVKVYLTIFRGTPMMVQLLIMYYVIFASVKANPIMTAVLAFGLNSGAYVAEAIRAGIMSVEIGQFEAGRSLGFTYGQTMIHIILPQAVKNALPAMCNEFIALLKESSIVGYIGLIDLTKAGDIIRSNTYEAFMPLIAVALVYLVIVMFLTFLVGRLERRLKKDAR
ncbi:MAG: ABC transporter permease subunit [Agathobacter sp.]|jgi:polar amino acid transport system substrate-binding protein|nr:ABC transporter permease subunit [Agathobacter sp.]